MKEKELKTKKKISKEWEKYKIINEKWKMTFIFAKIINVKKQVL